MTPPPTVLNAIHAADIPVITIRKVADLFDHQGIAHSHPTGSNEEGMAAIASLWPHTSHSLLFAKLVDFDTEFGDRRDVLGYGRALETFDRWLAGFLPQVAPNDLLLITADHGNDPTYPGTDHTREIVPLLARHANRSQNLGDHDTFSDVAATLATYFRLPAPWPVGRPIECVTQAAARHRLRPDATSPQDRAASPSTPTSAGALRERAHLE